MLSVGDHLTDQTVIGIHLILGLALQLGIFPQGIGSIRQRDLQLHGRFAGLGRMGLIHDDGEALAAGIIHFLVDHRELLQRGDNDTLSGVERVPQIPGGLLLVDGTDGAERMIEACDGLLELGIQVAPVRDDHDRVKDRLIFRIMQRGQTVGCPGDGVGLAGTRGVLNQIVVAGAVSAHVGQELAHHVQLMVAREDQLFIFRGMNELLQNVHHAVLLEDLLPQVGGGIAVRISGVALAAVVARAVGALVEGQEEGVLSGQLRGHPDFQQINAEVAQNALVELETDLPWVAVVHPLAFGVVHGLAGVLVFQLEGEHRDTVDGQHHVHAVVGVGGIEPLAVAGDLIGRVLLRRRLVQAGLRPEIADAKAHAPVLEAVAQHLQQPVHMASCFKGLTELPLRLRLVLHDEARPLLWVGLLHEAHQRLREQPQLGIIGVMVSRVPARRREQEIRDIHFKAFFGGFGDRHGQSLLSILRYSYQHSIFLSTRSSLRSHSLQLNQCSIWTAKK